MPKEPRVMLDGLTEAETLDLQKQVGPNNMQRPTQDRGAQSFGSLDPSTVAVLISAMTSSTVALWIVQHRTRRKRLTVVVEHSDGRKETREFTVDEETKSDADIARAVLGQVREWFTT